MPGRAKSLVHIWCFANCQKLNSLEKDGVTVDAIHVANVNGVSSNLIALARLTEMIDWEQFRPMLQTLREKPRKSNAGAVGSPVSFFEDGLPGASRSIF